MANFCTNCGKPVLKTDKYCTECGQRIQEGFLPGVRQGMVPFKPVFFGTYRPSASPQGNIPFPWMAMLFFFS